MRHFKECLTCTDNVNKFFDCDLCKIAKAKDKKKGDKMKSQVDGQKKGSPEEEPDNQHINNNTSENDTQLGNNAEPLRELSDDPYGDMLQHYKRESFTDRSY